MGSYFIVEWCHIVRWNVVYHDTISRNSPQIPPTMWATLHTHKHAAIHTIISSRSNLMLVLLLLLLLLLLFVYLFVSHFNMSERHRAQKGVKVEWNKIEIACQCVHSHPLSPPLYHRGNQIDRYMYMYNINEMVCAICEISLGPIFMYFYDYDVEILRLCLLC